MKDKQLYRPGQGPIRMVLLLILSLTVSLGTLAEDRWQPVTTYGIILPAGVVVEADQPERVFLMEPEGLTSRNLANGELLWRNPDAARPLGLAGDQLIALGEIVEMISEIPLLMLDPATGQVRRSMTIELPPDVLFLIDMAANRRFETWLNEIEAVTALEWWSEHRDLRGAPAISGATRQAKMPRTALVAAEKNQEEKAPMGEILRRHATGRVFLDASFERFEADPEVNPDVAAPQMIPDLRPSEQRAEMEGVQFRDAGDTVIMASQRLADARTWNRFQWTVFDRASERKLGSFRHYAAYAPFFVADNRLALIAQPYFRVNEEGYFEERPLRLEVWNLDEQSISWTVTLRDTAYRDTMPP